MEMDDDANFVLRWLAQMNDKRYSYDTTPSAKLSRLPDPKQAHGEDDVSSADRISPARSCGYVHKHSDRKLNQHNSSDSSLIEELKRPDHEYNSESIGAKSIRGSLDGSSWAQESKVKSQTSSLCEQRITTTSRRPEKVFEKRARYKTREDKYDEFKKLRKISKLNTKKSIKRRNLHRKSKFKITENVKQSLNSRNVEPDRLTIRPSFRRGIFFNGKASSSTGRRGIPDLHFSKMEFMKNLTPLVWATEGNDPTKIEGQKNENYDSIISSKPGSNFFGTSDLTLTEPSARKTRQLTSADEVSDSQSLSSKAPKFSKPEYPRSSSLPQFHLSSTKSSNSVEITKRKATSQVSLSEIGHEKRNKKESLAEKHSQGKVGSENDRMQFRSITPEKPASFKEDQSDFLLSDLEKLGTKDSAEKLSEVSGRYKNTSPIPEIAFNCEEDKSQSEQNSNDRQTIISGNNHITLAVENKAQKKDSAPDELKIAPELARILPDHTSHPNDSFELKSTSTLSSRKNFQELCNIKRPATTLPIMKTLSAQGPSARYSCTSQSRTHEKNFMLLQNEKNEIYESKQDIGQLDVSDRFHKVSIELPDRGNDAPFGKIWPPDSEVSNRNASGDLAFYSRVMDEKSNQQSDSDSTGKYQQIKGLTSFLDHEARLFNYIQIDSNPSLSSLCANETPLSLPTKVITKQQNQDEVYHFLSQVENNSDINFIARSNDEPFSLNGPELRSTKTSLMTMEERFENKLHRNIDDGDECSYHTSDQNFHEEVSSTFQIKKNWLETLRLETSYKDKNLKDINILNEALAGDINQMSTDIAFITSNNRQDPDLYPCEITHDNYLFVPETPEPNNLEDFWFIHRHH